MHHYLLLSGLWVWITGLLFAVIHSGLATIRCKQWFCDHGIHDPRYRLYYTLLSVLMTAIWISFVHQLADSPLYHADGLVKIVLITLQIAGAVVALAAFQPIDGLAFLGFRASAQGTDPFIVKGIYRYLRHPMYTGVMLILLAMPEQTWNGLNLALAVCAYFMIGARFEEQRMLVAHPEYAAYRRTVPAFIPGITVDQAYR